MPVFLAPICLAAAAAVLIPLALHLLRLRRPPVLPFSAIQFLRQADVRTRRARRLENLLLLLLRSLIILLLVLAFAMPVFDYAGTFGGDRRTLVLIFDAGAGMRMAGDEENEALFAKAREWGLDLLNTLERGDRAAILKTGSPEKSAWKIFPPASDHDRARERLTTMEPEFGRASPDVLCGQLPRRLEELGRSTDDRFEIHVFSDFQAHKWRTDRLAEAAENLEDHNLFFLNLLRPELSANAGIIEADFSPAVVYSEEGTLRARPTVRTGGDFSGDVRLRLFLQDSEKHSVSILPRPGETKETVLSGGFRTDNRELTGRLKLDADDMMREDNYFYFSLPREEQIEVTLITTTGENTEINDGRLFLQRALTPRMGEDGLFKVNSVSAAEFSTGETDATAPITILYGYDILDSRAVHRLREGIENGSRIIVFPRREDNDVELPTELGGWRELQVETRQHERMTMKDIIPMEDSDTAVQADISRALPFSLQAGTRRRLHFSGLPPEAETVFTYKDGSPFIWSAPVGEGRVWFATLPIDREISDWPLSPSFLVTLREIINHSLRQREQEMSMMTRIGSPMYLNWPTDTLLIEDAELISPAGESRQLQLERRHPNQPFTVEGFNTPGFYTLRAEGMEKTIAANLPSEEINFDYLAKNELTSGLPAERTRISENTQETLQHLELLDRGRTLWPWLLLAAFFLLAVEEIAANRKTN